MTDNINNIHNPNNPYNLNDPSSAASRAEIMDAKLDKQEQIARDKETEEFHERILYEEPGNGPRSKESKLAELLARHGTI